MNKYLNGHARPSLATLRRLCDFFGVDDHEILMDAQPFRALIKLRPPRLGRDRNTLQRAVDRLVAPTPASQALFEIHEGYYHAYMHPDTARGYFLRTLYRLYRVDGNWFTKAVDRRLDERFMLPSTLKYVGIALESFNRLVVYEREHGVGRSAFATFLYASDHTTPSYLPGLMVGLAPEGAHDITCIRIVWHYLGKTPNLRQALGQCGVVDHDEETLPDFVIECTDNRMLEGDSVFAPRF